MTIHDVLKAYDALSFLRLGKKGFTRWAWDVLEQCQVIHLLQQRPQTISDIMQHCGIRHEAMLRDMLLLIAGKGYVRHRQGMFSYIGPPKDTQLAVFQDLLRIAPAATHWATMLFKRAGECLQTGNPVDEVSFDQAPLLWDAVMRESTDALRAMMIRKALAQIPPLKANYKALVLGCGTGRDIELIMALTQAHCTIHAVDNSPHMLEVARHNLALTPPSILARHQVEFQIVDLSQPSFPDEYDIVIASLVLHHFTEGERAHLYRNVKCAIVQGGCMGIFQICNKDENHPSAIWVMHMMASHKGYPTQHRFKSELASHFKTVASTGRGHIWICRP